MSKTAHGTIFAVPLPDGTFVFGRVMLDVSKVLKRRLLPADSPLPFCAGAYLVEMYSQITTNIDFVPSPLLIPGAFVELREIGTTWPIVDQVAVDPRKVEFPEYLIGFRHAKGDGAFVCGEIKYPVPFTLDDVLKGINVLGGWHSAFLWPYVCLWALGRRSEIPAEYKTANLEDYDLRFSPHRARVYEHLPFSIAQSYFEKQAQLGLHVERLYE